MAASANGWQPGKMMQTELPRFLRGSLGRSSRWERCALLEGGLGWYIFQNRNELHTGSVFAGLVLIVITGLLVESWVLQHWSV